MCALSRCRSYPHAYCRALQTREITQLKGQVQASVAAPRTPSPSALPPGVVVQQEPGDNGPVAISAGPLAFAPAAPGIASGGFGTLRNADLDGRALGSARHIVVSHSRVTERLMTGKIQTAYTKAGSIQLLPLTMTEAPGLSF